MRTTISNRNGLDATLRDVGLSVLLGPFRFVIPVAAYFFIYPLIISKSGIEVLGIWSLFGAVSIAVSVVDIGFSQLLTREAGLDKGRQELRRVHDDYVVAKRGYFFVFSVLICIFWLFGDYILLPFRQHYSILALKACATLLLLGTALQLVYKLDSAILCARQDNYVVQIVSAISPFMMYCSAVGGAFLMRPIEGLSFGMVLSGMSTIFAYRWRLSRCHRDWVRIREKIPLGTTVSRIRDLSLRGKHLYTTSVGMIVREPIIRFVIATVVGLEGVATFDIAMRVTRVAREIIASGFKVLYPSFAYFNKNGYRKETIELARISLLILLPLGVIFLGTLIRTAGPIYDTWLKEMPVNLVAVTQVLAIWNALTLMNIPFWYLLQATNHERETSISIWLHTACILILIPLFLFVGKIELIGVVVYWTITALLTQIFIYVNIEKKLSLFWDVLICQRVGLVLITSFLFITFAFAMGINLEKNILESILNWGVSLALFTIVSLALVLKPIHQFFLSLRLTGYKQ
jgi:O-antigen/teichoic acid export membrane protein